MCINFPFKDCKMCSSLKQHQEIETKIHEQLYTNIHLLRHVYPSTKDFDAVFKRDMFVKNNKAAFHQIIYYLFNILNPQMTREKITWPLYDVKLENKFRNEVVIYVNDLNRIYEDADIPNIMASHLIFPGGFKFVKFMWKLSQLVLCEHLKKNEKIKSQMLHPIQPHDNHAVTDICLKNLKKKISLIEAETRQQYEKFIRRYENASQEASKIVFEQVQTSTDINDLIKTHEAKKRAFQEKNQIMEASSSSRVNEINRKAAYIEEVIQLCKRCDELLTYISSGKSVLDKDDFVLPHNIEYLCEKKNEFNLFHLFSNLVSVLEKENLEMPHFTLDELNNISKAVEELTEKCSRVDMSQATNRNKFMEALEVFRQFVDMKIEVNK